MRKLILFLLIVLACLLPPPADADSFTVISRPCPGGVTAATDACGVSTSLSYAFAYTGNHASGAGYACYKSTGTVSAENLTEADTGTNVTISADYVQFTAADNYVSWPVASGSNTGFSSSAGTIFFTYTVVDGDANSDLDANQPIEIRQGSGNYIYITTVDTGNYIQCKWRDNTGTAQTITSSVGMSLNTAYRVGYSWNAAGDVHSVSVVTLGSATSWEDSTGATLNAWVAEPTTIVVGDDGNIYSNPDTNRVTDIYIFSGVKATDPLAGS
jgi:hypothetical protein